ncbi:DUF6220 domain-containing protein [Paenibacillus alkalitolerans]|uniref:DUF6220 domain-containing protein n=1 Tax=Paenibacillus alkalitolerans TaxID=2799335 RepID=UPI001F1E322C|nr:DUF6220 domain-containing protein [Paenibacillus alkalitolerans]
MNRNVILAEKNGSLSPGARRAFLVLMWVARVFALLIAMQVFIAGMATFVDSENWMAHTNFARVFIFFPITMILLTFIARLPVTYRLKSIQLLVSVVLMYATAVFSSDIGIISALHPVIALAMFWISMTLAKQAAAHIRTKSPSMAA